MPLPPRLGELRDRLLDLVFPPHCVGCGRAGVALCGRCLRDLPRLEPPVCARCGLSLTTGHTCDWPHRHLDAVRSWFAFDGVAREAVHALKYGRLTSLARPLAELTAAALRDAPAPADALVAVPLHRARERERGYNQAELLARYLAPQLGLPLEHWVRRARPTPQQARAATAEQRRENVRGAFSAEGVHPGARVLALDDVCTTGATLDDCARALKEGGASWVGGLTFAREL